MVKSDGLRSNCGEYVKPLRAEPESSASAPAISCSTSPQSSADRHRGPILSSVQARAIAPRRLTNPYVGRKPVTPQKALGVMMEPDVSEPSANVARPAATAMPEPLDEPPAQRVRSQGFSAAPVIQ